MKREQRTWLHKMLHWSPIERATALEALAAISEVRRLRKALAPLANGSTYREHLDAGLAALKPKRKS